MFNRSLWSWPILIPIAALYGCSSPVDGSPFDDTANSGATNGSTVTSTPSAPSSGSGTPAAPAAPSNPGLGNEVAGPLPVAPAAGGTGGASGTGGAGGAGGAAPGAAGAGVGGAPVVPPPVQEPPPPPPPPVVVGDLDPRECASYETGFLPLVHDPVCSSCHTNNGGLPRFEPFAQADNRCNQIGREVASGDMPPNGRLSADQRAVVASWVALGCPETAEDAAALCVPAAPNDPTPPPPPPVQGGGNDDDDDDDDGDDDDDDDDDGDDDDDDDDDD